MPSRMASCLIALGVVLLGVGRAAAQSAPRAPTAPTRAALVVGVRPAPVMAARAPALVAGPAAAGCRRNHPVLGAFVGAAVGAFVTARVTGAHCESRGEGIPCGVAVGSAAIVGGLAGALLGGIIGALIWTGPAA